MQLQFFAKQQEKFVAALRGAYPEKLIETAKDRSLVEHTVNEALTRPWITHYFLMHHLRSEQAGQDEIIARDHNLIEILKTTIPLAGNSFTESAMRSWQMFLGSAFRDAEAPWHQGNRKVMVRERFHSAIEQLELEMPSSNPQHMLQFYDHLRVLRKIPRVPIKLFFALPGNEKEKVIAILRQSVAENPHNTDVALLAYCFFRAWDRTSDFLDLARQENRPDLEEWYYWIENDMHSLGALKRESGDFLTSFFVYDRALLAPAESKELADWYLRENEFKSAYHFYYKAKEFETALELLQNISTKEFGDLTNLRRLSRGERPLEFQNDASRLISIYQEEMETLRGFARIRAAETYRQIAVKAREHFDRETIETKYAFGELTDDEYQRLIRQLQERQQ